MEQEELDNKNNRFENKVSDIISLPNTDSMMYEIREIANEVDEVPSVGKYYTFVYQAKTPRILYDTHPLIACTEVLGWGFKGLNYHWGTWRQYTWDEVLTGFHIIYPMERTDLRSIPYQNFIINN